MKKTLIAACFAVSATIILSSCSATGNASEGYELAGGKNVDYTFEYPSAWNKSRDDGMIAVKSEQSGANISVTAYRPVEDYESCEDYFEAYKANFEKTLGSYAEESVEDVIIDGIYAKKITYTATVMDSEFKFASIVCIRNKIVYTITYTAVPDEFDAHLPTLTHVIQTFDFT